MIMESMLATGGATHTANTDLTTNNLSISLKGGRHHFKLIIDYLSSITESDETDNSWLIAPAIYEPYDLDTDTDHLILRDEPPDRNPEGYSFFSCDGYHFTVANTTDDKNWWGAVGILPATNTSNYDVRLHDDYTGSSQGFGSNHVWSSSGANGIVEIIGVNANVATTTSWFAGVIHGNTAPTYNDYVIQSDGSDVARQAPSTGITGNIPVNGVVSVEEIRFGTDDLGIIWRVTVTPAGSDIAIALIIPHTASTSGHHSRSPMEQLLPSVRRRTAIPRATRSLIAMATNSPSPMTGESSQWYPAECPITTTSACIMTTRVLPPVSAQPSKAPIPPAD